MVEELGESKVPLTKDIINRTKEFQQTYFEFIAREGIQIQRAVTLTNNNVYTVPTNKIFYLFHMNVTASTDSPAVISNPNGWQILESGSDQGICQVNLNLIGASYQNSINPSMPIVFNEGVAFSFIGGTNFTGFMFGLEVDKEIAFRR